MSDYDEICRLAEQGDQVHSELLPDVFQPFEGPARSLERIAGFVDREDADIIVAALGTSVVGCLYIEKSRHLEHPMFRPHEYAQIDEMVVDHEQRRQGIGGLLLDSARQWSRDRGMSTMQVNVWTANQDARAFYAKRGFHPITQKMEIVVDEADTKPPAAKGRVNAIRERNGKHKKEIGQ